MTPTYCDELRRAAEAITAADGLALGCHVTPDGDALGSMLAMMHLARAQAMPCCASWPEPFVVARHYRSIPGTELAVAPHQFPAAPNTMMTFDCGSLRRLQELSAPACRAREHGQLIVVDHHASNDRYGTINPIDDAAAATAVVVRDLARELRWELNRDAAMCLYTGLVTDTGRFQFSSTTPSVFALAHELASFDLPIAKLSRELFEEHRFSYLKLAARALGRAELDTARSFVSSSVTRSDLADFGVDYDEIEGLIEWLRSTAEAEVACLCKEAPDGVRVSLRSVSEVDVGAIAIALGGGGHRLAAGFTMNASVADVLAAVRARLPDAVANTR